jgi:phenylacetate-coenzyme A ligase PaaK-like adenylate-forming protein
VIDDVHSIREYQIVQTQRDEIVVSVVPDAHFTPAMAATFVRGIERRLGEPMKVRLREVDKIDRPKSQKTRLVVSTFGQAFFDGSATERETPVT